MERKTIYASDGMILTDGEIYGTQIHLADGVDDSNFYEISREEYERKLQKEAEEAAI